MYSYKTSDFNYHLPEELIANNPLSIRDKSRLLVVHNANDGNSTFSDLCFDDLLQFINSGDLVIFNDSKVIKARLFGNKISGGKIELLIERVLHSGQIISHIRSNKTINVGLLISIPGNVILEVIEKLDGLFCLMVKDVDPSHRFDDKCASLDDKGTRKDDTNVCANYEITNFNWYKYLDEFGNIPLPPYMKREAGTSDDIRYQTVYAKNPGSVAAPTAGLHFTQELLDKIKNNGVNIAHVTLHVGSGTFKPVSVEELSQHKMHSEVYDVAQSTIDLIHATKSRGNKVIAVGTTSLRVLESIARNNFAKLSGETDIFITPGFEFKVVDKLVTNFHLPQSTLLMLVSAFAGFDRIKAVYSYAITNKYRFYSYGDAMLLERKI